MRTVFRRILIVLLLLGGLGCLGYWWIMRRTFPEHAQYIPANASYVITINLREVGKDLLQGGSSSDGSSNAKDTSLANILRERKGSGIRLLSDVLVFGVPGTDSVAAYDAAVFQLSDATAFSALLHDVIQQKMPGTFFENGKHHAWRNTGKHLLLAWDDATAMVLQHHEQKGEQIEAAMFKLFAQTPVQSLCSNVDFIKHQEETFDIGFWGNVEQLQAHPPSMAMTYLPGSDTPPAYIHGIVRFVNGNIGINLREVYGNKPKPKERTAKPMAPVAEQFVAAYWQGDLGPEKNFRGNMMGNWLQQQTNAAQAIRECLGGYYSVTLHDTVHYWKRFVKNTYDENFNMVEVRDSVRSTMPGITLCFEVKQPGRLDTLLTEWAWNDSLPKNKNGFIQLRGDYPLYVANRNGRLLVTAKPVNATATADGAMQKRLQVENGYILPPRIEAALPADSVLFPGAGKTLHTAGKTIQTISWSNAAWVNDQRISEIRIEFTDPGTNGLTQLLGLLHF
jgi:hypothetical protein